MRSGGAPAYRIVARARATAVRAGGAGGTFSGGVSGHFGAILSSPPQKSCCPARGLFWSVFMPIGTNMDKFFSRRLWALAAGFLWIASAASAQAVRSGPTFLIGGTPQVVNPDAAYDPVHDRYLVVHGRGFVDGLLTAADGKVIAQVSINASRNAWAGEDAQTVRVAFSPDVNNGAGGYLVTWHETITPVLTQVRARLVSADGTPLGTDFIVSTYATGPGLRTNWTDGAPLAYA